MASKKSSSYPGTPRSLKKVSVNLNNMFEDVDDECTIVPDQSTAYQTALEDQSSAMHSSLIIQEEANKGIDSIKQMESLRHQIHSSFYPNYREISPGNLSDTSSVDTIALLRSTISLPSPELQLDENGILIASMNNLKSLYHSPSSILDSSLAAENTILKENIEKERLRRKHCEDQIKILQQKLLDSQEQLAVSVSTDRKKQIMIEQLDNTLANVVEGWKKKESLRDTAYKRVCSEKETLESTVQRQEELLSNFENELADAVTTINDEKSKLQKQEQSFIEQIQDYSGKLKDIEEELTKTKEENTLLSSAKEGFVKDKETLLNTHQQEMEDLRKNLMCSEALVAKQKDELNSIGKSVQANKVEFEQQMQVVVQECHKLQSHLKDKDNTIKTLQQELNERTKEKESLSVEIDLLNAKFDTLKTKQDSEMKTQLENQFNQQIQEIQQQISITETELRNSKKKQIVELMQQHKMEIEKYRKFYQQEMKKKEDQISKLRTDHEQDLNKAKKQIESLSIAGQSLEKQRSDLMQRMKLMMQQHWDETVSLISNNQKNKMVTVDDSLSFQPLTSTFHQQHQYQHRNLATPHHNNQQPPQRLIETHNPKQHYHQTSIQQDSVLQPSLSESQQDHHGNSMSYQHQQTPQQQSHPRLHSPSKEPNVINRPRTSSPVDRNKRPTNQQYADSPSRKLFTDRTLQEAVNTSRVDVNKQDPISLLYQDLDEEEVGLSESRGIATTTDTSRLSLADGKNVQLTHFIETLLQRSPGQPLDEIPVKDDVQHEERVPVSISQEVDKLLQKEKPPPSSSQNTPKKQPIKMNKAFKKSVVRQSKQETNSRIPEQDDAMVTTNDMKDGVVSSGDVQLVHLLKNLLVKELGNSTDERTMSTRTNKSLPSNPQPNSRPKQNANTKKAESKTTNVQTRLMKKKPTKSSREMTKSKGLSTKTTNTAWK
ncbi:centrobin-like [Clytia hemisphaerica]|uniref:centrobin-like n=1 Tax=Clytia hemisphaerica TaxID=252671 RepID=UPI0034D3EBA5